MDGPGSSEDQVAVEASAWVHDELESLLGEAVHVFTSLAEAIEAQKDQARAAAEACEAKAEEEEAIPETKTELEVAAAGQQPEENPDEGADKSRPDGVAVPVPEVQDKSRFGFTIAELDRLRQGRRLCINCIILILVAVGDFGRPHWDAANLTLQERASRRAAGTGG